MFTGLGQAPYGHVAVETLVLSLFHEIGLMKNADGTIRPYGLVEFSPRRQMLVAMACVVLQMLVGAPVLDLGKLSHVPVRSRAQKPQLRMLIELFQHAAHRGGYRNPFVEGQSFVDSHPDDKDDKGPFHVCRKTTRNYFCHAKHLPHQWFYMHVIESHVRGRLKKVSG